MANGTITSSWLKFENVTISDDKIEADETTAACAVEIEKISGQSYYSIKLPDGKYLGTPSSNSIKSATSLGNDFYWKFSLSGNLVKIESNAYSDRHLRLNGSSGFRTYTSNTGTQATLYRLETGEDGGGTTDPEEPGEGGGETPSANTYTKFTGTLVEGDYIIVYDNGAMNTTVSSNRLQFTTVSPVGDVISEASESIVWHIAKNGSYWTIYNASANKYAASTGTKNQAALNASGTDNKSLWTVSGTSTYEFVNKHNSSNSINSNLRKNTTYGFACYASSTGGALTLYKKD